MTLLKLDYFDKFMRPYEDGESQRSARSKLGLFLEGMGFPAQNFKNSELKNEEIKVAKIEDLRERCNAFCKEFREKYDNEGVEECQDILMSYLDSLKQKAKEGKLDGGTIKNRKFTVKRLIEKTMNIKDIDWEGLFEGLPKPSRFAQDRVYTTDEIRQICKYTDPRIKPIVYFFVSSGVRLGAWDYLKWGHISPQEWNGKIVCALVEVYKDTPEQYPTLITVEAYNALKEWMDFRERSGEIISPDSWVMRDYWDTEEGFTHGMAREPQQLKSTGIKSLIDSAVRRQGLRKNITKEDKENGKKRHDIQLNHSFRKFRETQLIRAGLKLVDVNILQGHANDGMVDHYYRPSADPNNRIDDYLINEFLKAEKYLIIDETYNTVDELKGVKEDLKQRDQIISKLAFNSWLRDYKDLLSSQLVTGIQEANKIITVEEQIRQFKQYFYDNFGQQLDDNQLRNMNIKEIIITPTTRRITIDRD